MIKVRLIPDLHSSLLNCVMMLLGGICLELLSAFDNLASDTSDKSDTYARQALFVLDFVAAMVRNDSAAL